MRIGSIQTLAFLSRWFDVDVQCVRRNSSDVVIEDVPMATRGSADQKGGQGLCVDLGWHGSGRLYGRTLQNRTPAQPGAAVDSGAQSTGAQLPTQPSTFFRGRLHESL